MPRRHREAVVHDGPGFFNRLLGLVVGGAAGGVLYVGWGLFSVHRWEWAWSSPLKWFVLAGALFGAIGGLALARSLWEHAMGDAASEASKVAVVAGVVVVVIVILVLAMKMAG